MAEPTPTAISQSTPEELSHFSFSLFVKLPAELQLDILSHCQKNDLICLSLSSYYFRDLTQPLIPSRPRLSSFDQKLPVGPTDCACGDELSIVRVSQDTRAHRQRRHVYAYYQKARSGGDISHPWGWNHPLLRERCEKHSGSPAYPADHPLCHKRGCAHCSCTTCPLHVRLRSWMGDRKYCSQCRKFTVRMSTKKYKGRCLHGRTPVRRSANNHWTYKKGQSYGNRWWRRWGTCTVESWGYPEGDTTADVSKRRNTRVV